MVSVYSHNSKIDDILAKILIIVLGDPLFITVTSKTKSINPAEREILSQELWFQSSRNNQKVSTATLFRFEASMTILFSQNLGIFGTVGEQKILVTHHHHHSPPSIEVEKTCSPNHQHTSLAALLACCYHTQVPVD